LNVVKTDYTQIYDPTDFVANRITPKAEGKYALGVTSQSVTMDNIFTYNAWYGWGEQLNLITAYGKPATVAGIATLPTVISTNLVSYRLNKDTAYAPKKFSRPHVSLVGALANCGGFAMVVYLIFKIVLGPIVFGIFASDVA